MSKPDPIKQFNDWMRNNLRRTFFKFWERTKTIQAARISRGLYTCADCKQVMKIKGMKVDHIQPVVDPQVGFINWDIYIKRLFCAMNNLQLLCGECHDRKTERERLERKAAKTGIYSPERRQKISAAKTGVPNIKIRRAIIGIHKTEGGREFESTKEAAEVTGIPRKRITDILIGRRLSAKDWSFKYKE